ncbi:RAD52 motif-containing protein 1 isoform X1 [Octopus bimaculoides]|uniref:RRM domain-containing protein n=1 Tax=Octopus bimaculoides TaxID=37653 RepID=A0A0L8FIJ6_OCTBM|nr:RAD52 motif-containing protein 1 isoform X1 [Octopus bimaculoides]|eukprot:XP_014789530.1 PREDICTED: RAD52 motif-containing protein 1-like isoform X1 [Octopus bimaculoides]
MNDIEIIEFCPPHSNRKNLFVSNIPLSLPPADIYDILYEKFSAFGLLYEIQLFSNTNQQPVQYEHMSHAGKNDSVSNNNNAYAFVKYYSIRASQSARRNLNCNLYIGGQQCKIVTAKRKNIFALEYLSLNKCYDVANFYFGFNGWTTNIKLLKQDTYEMDTNSTICKVCFCSLSTVSLPFHRITSEGFGAWEETWNQNDPLQKLTAYHKARKICYQRSIVNAFSKILVLVLPNGKICAELNTSKPDIYCGETFETNLLEINELDQEPEDDGNEENTIHEGVNLDALNIQLLQELEDF